MCIYKIYYFSTYAATRDEKPWIAYVEAPLQNTKEEFEKLCEAKIPDMYRLHGFEKLNVIKLA